MDQSGANQSSFFDTGIISLRRQFDEMRLLNDALMAMESQVYSPSQVFEALNAGGFSLNVIDSQQSQQVNLLKLDLNLLQMALRYILNCLSRRGKIACDLEIQEQQHSLSITVPAADSGIIENSVIATFAIEILVRMGAIVDTDKESISISFQTFE